MARIAGVNIPQNKLVQHDINFDIPEGVKITVEKQTILKITGYDKQQVGTVASKIKTFRKIEPYKGKGVKYSDERIIRKESKKVVRSL